jgi:A/G-specific adenine glycosylase
LALPGIGRYTAGAICSIAYNQPHPVLDGNVIRVLTRLYGITGDARAHPVQAELWNAAQALVERAAAGQQKGKARVCAHFNQALMELGALVCKPKEPECDRCPLRRDCRARQLEITHRLPNLGKRAKAVGRQFTAFIARRGQRVLVRQRPAGVVNAHLWEFPNLERVEGGDGDDAAALHCLGWKPDKLQLVCVVHHSITRYRIRLHAYLVETTAAKKNVDGRWVNLAELEELALPSAHRRIALALRRRSQGSNEREA